MSTTEWIPSEIMADEPVKMAAMNFITAMIRLPITAATTANLDSPCDAMQSSSDNPYRVQIIYGRMLEASG